MVTKLYYFKSLKQLLSWAKSRGYSLKAARAAWTGPGYYYARSKSHISKHDVHLDKRRGKLEGKGEWRHIHDLAEKLAKEITKAALKAEKKSKGKVEAKKVVELTVKRAKRKAKVKRLVKGSESYKIAKKIWSRMPQEARRRWTFIQLWTLVEYIKRRVEDIQAIDLESFDWNLTYRELKHEVEGFLAKALKDYTIEELKGMAGKLSEELPQNFERISSYTEELLW